MNQQPVSAIDADGFASLVEMIGPDMPEVVADILDTYREEANKLIQNIERSAVTANLDEMLLPVHSLKSSSASLGALILSSLCAELEQYLRGFGPVLDVDGYVKQIVAEYSRAQSELEILRDEYASK